MKKNILLRAALLLLALTMATLPVASSVAKYTSLGIASANEFHMFHLMPAVTGSRGTATSYSAALAPEKIFKNTGDQELGIKGYWAFYLKGQKGATSGNNWTGGPAGVAQGIFYSADSVYYALGKTRGGNRSGVGGDGGSALYLLYNSTTVPTESSHGQLIGIAGGGGGAGNDNYGGKAGIQNGPGANSGWSGYGYNSTVSVEGPAGGNGGTSPDGKKAPLNQGGGGTGTEGGIRGGLNGGSNGNFFQTGTGGDSQNSGNVAGGGAGYYGGGGGGDGGQASTNYDGAGGGGSSYVKADCWAVPTAKFTNPKTYYEHAVNYFLDQIASVGELNCVLVWLGPELPA